MHYGREEVVVADVHMLLVYSLERRKLVDVAEFDDGDEAFDRYMELEREHLGDSSLEIVLVAADSAETIRHTHASYFDDVADGLLDLDGLIDLDGLLT